MKLLLAALLLDWFGYDAKAPLDYRETLVRTADGVRISDSSYASPMGGRVQAYTVTPPEGRGPFAGVVWQHGGGQRRNWFLPDAIALAKLGVVSILMDAPGNRPREMQAAAAKNELEDDRQRLVQVVLDSRRAFDVLAARGDVDPKRIAYVGLSFGAMMGGSLAGTDHRFKTFVLICGLEGFVRHYGTSRHPGIVEMRERFPKDEFPKFLATFEPIDAKNFIGKATAPLLFQAARFDVGVSESDTNDYFAMAPEPKELKWYDSGHDLNDPQAFADRQAWLRRQLALK